MFAMTFMQSGVMKNLNASVFKVILWSKEYVVSVKITKSILKASAFVPLIINCCKDSAFDVEINMSSVLEDVYVLQDFIWLMENVLSAIKTAFTYLRPSNAWKNANKINFLVAKGVFASQGT